MGSVAIQKGTRGEGIVDCLYALHTQLSTPVHIAPLRRIETFRVSNNQVEKMSFPHVERRKSWNMGDIGRCENSLEDCLLIHFNCFR